MRAPHVKNEFKREREDNDDDDDDDNVVLAESRSRRSKAPRLSTNADNGVELIDLPGD